MEELDSWTAKNVISPLYEVVRQGDSLESDATCEDVKKAIRTKVLESYRNGQKAGPRPAAAVKPARKEFRR